MQRVVSTAALAVSWHERKYFEKMFATGQSEELPISYEAWPDNAYRDMRKRLKQGRPLKIVTIHLDDYFAWLPGEVTSDSAMARTRHIEELTASGGRFSGNLSE